MFKKAILKGESGIYIFDDVSGSVGSSGVVTVKVGWQGESNLKSSYTHSRWRWRVA